ncbi:MAG: extracellular solute-binding protein [Mycobacteriales bacterium]|nr:MAG: ABC transporter substrate-binding protein [Pseudonocardiales bacterium]
MRVTRRASAYVIGLVVISVVATGCVGAKKNNADKKRNATAKNVTLVIGSNSIKGGKNTEGAVHTLDYTIPKFEAMEKAKGVNVKVTFQGSGADDEIYKQRLALSLKVGGGPDVFSMDGIWLGEFAQAGYIKPLDQVVGSSVGSWDGWSQISSSIMQNATFGGQRYGIPSGTDGRILYFNKKLFAKAGLPATWQPKSWADIIAAGKALKKLPGITPLQIDAGTAMGEATTTQGFLPLLAGAGQLIYDDKTKKWQGATPAVKNVLSFYQQIYSGGLGDPKLQEDQNGRDQSFAAFSQGKVGVLAESDYLWRSVICPDKSKCNTTAMPDRNQTVGFALIPAMKPGSGVAGQNFVSISGGGDEVINPNTKYPQQAWELMQFMASKASVIAGLAGTAQITERSDVNAEVLKNDPLLSFINTKVLPITRFRPGLAVYSTTITTAIQQATLDVVTGKSVGQAAQTYQQTVEKAVGANAIQTG